MNLKAVIKWHYFAILCIISASAYSLVYNVPNILLIILSSVLGFFNVLVWDKFLRQTLYKNTSQPIDNFFEKIELSLVKHFRQKTLKHLKVSYRKKSCNELIQNRNEIKQDLAPQILEHETNVSDKSINSSLNLDFKHEIKSFTAYNIFKNHFIQSSKHLRKANLFNQLLLKFQSNFENTKVKNSQASETRSTVLKTTLSTPKQSEATSNLDQKPEKNSIFNNSNWLPYKRFVTTFSIFFLVIVTVNLYFYKPLPVEAVATPNVSLNLPAETKIGENFSFSATFSNTGTTTGYGPYIDLVFPVTGIDGAGVATDDGIDFISASYLGAAVTATQLTFPVTGTGCSGGQTPVTHPYAVNNLGQKQTICGNPGDKLVVLQLPFGSFVTTQPNVSVSINASLSNLADAGTPLTIQSRAGFRYGNDSLYNPATDPSIVGVFANSSTTPTILSLSKTYLGPENETATGPNFPRQYRVSVDIANGQTVTNLDLQDFLPNNLAFKQMISITPGTGTATVLPTVGSPENSPNNRINVRFPSITGGSGSNDAQFVFEYFVPDQNANATDVINHTTGDDTTSTDDAKTSGSWAPIDGRDTPTTVSSDVTLNDHTLNDKSIAIQKSVQNISASTNKPGDSLEYTLNTQISDYFAFQNLKLTDVFSDGQLFDNGFTPTLSWTSNGSTTNTAFNPANYTVVRDTPGTGNTTVVFDISSELLSRGLNSQVLGGCVPLTGGTVNCSNFNGGSTQGVVKFRSTIQQQFTDTFPSGEPNVDMGDILTNNVTANGDVLDNNTLNPTGQSEADTSSTSITIGNATLTKTIYAVNGSTGFTSPVRLAPGDSVTYRLKYNLDVSDVENLYLIDYLPLPAFLASSVNTTFDPTVSAAVPATGQAKFGPTDTYYGISNITPTVTIDNPGNSLKFNYGNFADSLNRNATLDVLFTVAMQDQPFADGMFLTNQARSHFGTTNSVDQTADSIVQVEINLPNISITKGAVSSDNTSAIYSPTTKAPVSFSNPGGSCSRFSGSTTTNNLATSPIGSNISNVDAGDKVTFAIALQNSGQNSGGGFDIKLKDDLPAGYSIPIGGANMCVTNGLGSVVNYTPINLIETSPLFGSGIELTDPSPTQGAIGTYSPTSGQNIIIVTYDLILNTTVQPNQTIINTATLMNYAGLNGGTNYATVSDFTTQTTQIINPSISKTLNSTDQTFTTGSNLAIGEKAQFDVLLTVPEGTTNLAKIIDTLDPGLAFVSIDSITPSSGALTTSIGTFNQVQTNAVVSNLAPLPNQAGRVLTLDFGTLTNADTTNSTTETIDIKYTTIVVNTSDAVRSATKRNSAVFSWNNGQAQSLAAAQATTKIAEPAMRVTKTVSPASGDAGDTLTYTIVVSQNAVADTTDAYELTLTDPIPTKTTYVASSVANTAGLAPDSLSFGSNQISASWNRFKPSDTSTITFQVTIDNTVTAKEVLANTATAKYSSLPGTINTAQSTYHTLSTERTGNTADIGGASNNYTTTGSVNLTVTGTTPVKTLISTSESSTGLAAGTQRVAVGEVVRYRLVTLLPEGTLGPNTIIRDQIPNGMRYLNDGTSTIAFVSNGGGVTSSAITTALPGCSSLNVSGSSSSITPTCPIPSSVITPLTFVTGTDSNFNIGSITNSDNDADAEYAVVELNALVENVVGNQANTTLANNFQIYVNGSATALDTSANVNVIVAEPSMTVTKTITQTPVDAGDTIKYSLTFRNNSSGNNAMPAFDLVATDPLNSNLTLTGTNVLSSPVYATVTNNTSGNNLSYNIDTLNPNDSVVIEVTATLNANIATGFTIPNTANVTFTSLPGSTGTTSNSTGSATPGATGTATGERNGSVGALNDYSVNGSLNTILTAAPTIDKLTPTTTQYTIGETPTYDIKVTLPEGVTQVLQVVDTFPAGLNYESYEVITTSASSGGNLSNDFAGTVSTTPTVTNAGSVYTFSFGDTTTTNDNSGTNNTFILRVHTKVKDIPTNQNAVVLSNTATVKYNNATSGVQTVTDPTPANVSLLEPNLTLTKNITPANAAPGDTVTMTFVMQNTGTATAYDIVATDNIDSTKFSNVTELSTPVDFNYNFASNTVTYTGSSLAAGQSRTFTITAKINSSLTNGQVVTNTAQITQYSSLSGIVTGERTYPTVTANANLNIQTPNLQITKTDGVSAAIPGQSLIYNLKVDNIGSYKAENIQITENIPLYSTFNNSNSTSGWICTGNVCTFDITLINAGGTQTVLFALDLNNTIPSGQNNFTNTASVVDDGTHGSDPDLLNNQSSDTDQLNYAPDLQVTKTDNNFNATVNDIIVYTLNYGNIGSQDSNLVVITENVPSNTTFNSANSSSGWNCVGNTCTYAVGDLNVAQTGSIFFAVKVNPSLPAGVNSTINTVSIADDGLNGADLNPSDNTANETTPLDALPDLKITKTDGVTTTTENQNLTYSLTIENIGTQGATGVEVTDNLPNYTSFVSADNGGTNTGNQVKWTGLTLNAQETKTLQVVAKTDATFVSNVNSITNQAQITDDGTNGTDPDLLNNQTQDLDQLNVQPELQISITDNAVSATPSQNLTYDINYKNNGPQAASGVTITVAIPAYTSYDSLINTIAWICPDNNAGTICSYTLPADLLSGGTGNLTFVVKTDTSIPSGVTQTTTTTNIADDGNNGVDPITSNNQASETTPIQALPDLNITKTDGSISNIVPGQNLIYTLNYSNTGNKGATGVYITEIVPLNTVFIPAQSTSGWSCTPDNNAGSVCTYSVGNLNSTASGNVTFAVKPNIPWPIGVSDISNTASIDDDNANGIDPTPQNSHDGESSIVTPVLTSPSPTATKTDSLGIDINTNNNIDPGDTILYTVVLGNNGTQNIQNPVFNDTLDPLTTLVTGSVTTTQGTVTTGNNPSDTQVSVDLGTPLVVGDTVTITFRALVPSNIAGNISLYNQGVLQGSNITDTPTDDPDTSATGDSTKTDVLGEHDLTITQTDGVVTTGPDDELEYTLTITNNGTVTAHNIEVVDTLPDILHTTYVSSDNLGIYTLATHSVTWPLFDLSAGQSVTRKVKIQVNNPLPAGVTSITNSVSAYDDGIPTVDTNITNNTAVDIDSIGGLTAGTDILIVKTDGKTLVDLNQNNTYNIVIQNLGNRGASGLIVTDVLPSSLGFVSASNAGSFNLGTNTVTWNLSNLSVGQTITLVLVTKVIANGKIENTSTVIDDGNNGPDLNPLNNSSTDISVVDYTIGTSIKIVLKDPDPKTDDKPKSVETPKKPEEPKKDDKKTPEPETPAKVVEKPDFNIVADTLNDSLEIWNICNLSQAQKPNNLSSSKNYSPIKTKVNIVSKTETQNSLDINRLERLQDNLPAGTDAKQAVYGFDIKPKSDLNLLDKPNTQIELELKNTLLKLYQNFKLFGLKNGVWDELKIENFTASTVDSFGIKTKAEGIFERIALFGQNESPQKSSFCVSNFDLVAANKLVRTGTEFAFDSRIWVISAYLILASVMVINSNISRKRKS